MTRRAVARTVRELRSMAVGRHSSLQRVMRRAADELCTMHAEQERLARELHTARLGRAKWYGRLRNLRDWQRKVIRERKEMRDRLRFLSSHSTN